MCSDVSEVKQDVDIVEEVDIEAYGKANEIPPEAKFYLLRIDKTKYKTSETLLTGKQLLDMAQKQPVEQYKIFQKLHGGQRKEIKLDETVDLRAKGIERFQTVPLCETEG